MYRMLPAGTQWVEAEGVGVVALAHLQPVASAHRQAPRGVHRLRAPHVAVAHVAASQHGGARPQPCAKLPPPSSWLSILFEFP